MSRTVGCDREGLRPERGPPPVAARGVDYGRRPPRRARGQRVSKRDACAVAGRRVSLPPRPFREVAYAGITKEQRADLHERHGSWLEQRNEADELVGYHAEQAHRYRGELSASDPELARLAAWAGERLAAAGIRAWKRADTPATINLLERAAGLLSRQRPEHAESCASSGSPKGGRATLMAPRKRSTKRSTRRRIAERSSEPGSNRPTFGSSANPLRTLTTCSTSRPSRSRSSRSSVMTAALDGRGGTSDTFAAGSRAVSQTGEKQPSARSSTIAALDGQRQAA